MCWSTITLCTIQSWGTSYPHLCNFFIRRIKCFYTFRAHGLHDGSKEWIDWPAKGYEELFVNLPLVCACAVGYLGSRMWGGA